MLQLLAAITQTDPAPIAGWMLLLLALGMYPVGILLPSCCACGGCPHCETGTLPNTVTVTFPEWDDEMLGEYRHRIAFSAPPEWTTPRSRASARVSETVNGEITKIDIVDGGSGYALVGRVAPTLTISGGGGAGATFTPTLTSSGPPAVWTLASATASGGSGYVDGSSLTITAAAGDTTVTKATATVIARGEPTITATVLGGNGATFAVTLSKSAASPPTWSVASIAVIDGGSGYTNNASVSFSIGGATQVTAAAATVSISAGVPAVEIDASDAGGAGATFSVAWNTPYEDEFLGLIRTIQSISLTSGGSGYDTASGPVVLRILDGTTVYGFESFTEFPLAVTVMDGAIVSVDGIVDPQDPEYTYGVGDLSWLGGGGSTGPIQSVQVNNGGSYYLPTGAAYGVTVTGGGSYYREGKTVTPYVATVTATVENASSGLDTPTLTPVVDDDPNSATFGQIESVTITDGGGGHKYRSLYLGKRCCKSIFGGKSFVLTRNPSDPCQLLYRKCEGFGETIITLTIPDNGTEYGPQPAYLTTSSGDSVTLCGTRWTATTLITDCSDLNLYLESGDRIATVAPGGNYHGAEFPEICSRCCTAGTLPDEIEVELESIPYQSAGMTLSDFDGWEGNYVLESGGVFIASTSAAWGFGGEIPSRGAPTIEALAGGVSFGLATLSGSGTPTIYTVTGVTIMAPGTGHWVGQPVTFRVVWAGPGNGLLNASGTVSSVGANGEILGVTITNAGAYEGYWLRMQVQFQHCGEAVVPPGVLTHDPSKSTDKLPILGFGTNFPGLRQAAGVEFLNWEKPAAPPAAPGQYGPPFVINAKNAVDGFPGTTAYLQDYVSHCGTDCSKKCFLVAAIVTSSGSSENYSATNFNDSKPYGAALIYETEAGREEHPPRVINGYEAFFSYFSSFIWPGFPAWIWNGNVGEWQYDTFNSPRLNIGDTWPGRRNGTEPAQATCAACESNLCNLAGKAITIHYGNSDRAKLTIS